MKVKIRVILIIGFLLCLTGCHSAESSSAAIAVNGRKVTGEMLQVFASPVVEREPYFTVAFGEAFVNILLSDCVCEYADTDFQIYSKFIYYDKEKFPYNGTIVYMRTPKHSMQIFSPRDYCIDKENGVIYFLFQDENDSFSSVYKYFAEEISGDVSISGAKVISTYLVDDWIAETFGLTLNENSDSFSDISLKITFLEYEQGDVILGGEASGIYTDTGKRYYIDWKLNDTNNDKKAVPHVIKIYDEEKDREVFKACREAFDLIEQGDCSVIAGHADRYWSYGGGNDEKDCYRYVDVNGDGLPELINVYASSNTRREPIEYIYTYTGGMAKTVEQVYVDLNDYTEYLFIGNGENLIYDYSDHGQMDYGNYTGYKFDENWNKQPLHNIQIYYFYDTDYYDEEEDVRYKEYYPDTYGSRGGGYYFFKDTPIINEESGVIDDWSREEITKEEFLEIYREMTGLDFFEENTDF